MTDIPKWAAERAVELVDQEAPHRFTVAAGWVGCPSNPTITAFARYIAEHEQPPVDPLLVEARKIIAKHFERDGLSSAARDARAGKSDHVAAVKAAYEALRRGIEIGKGG